MVCLTNVSFCKETFNIFVCTPTGKIMTLLGCVLGVESVTDHGHVIEADFLK